MAESGGEKYRSYLEQRQDYARTAAEHLTRFERSVLVASGGGLAAVFSLLLNEKLARTLGINVAVIAFGSSFFFMLVGHYLSYFDNEHAIKSLDSNFELDSNEERKRRCYSYLIEPLNIASVSAMVVGYILFALSI